jgi:hypothetical protein
MTRSVDDAIAAVVAKTRGRTRYAGQELCDDELLVAEIERLRTEIEMLRAAVQRMLVGGNHLAAHIDFRGPHYGCHHEEGLEYYGAGPAYDMWCCWKAIMTARDEIERPAAVIAWALDAHA